jgi:hypothetical protein
MMKGTFQVAGPRSHVLPNFMSLYGLKYPRDTQVRPSLQLQGVLTSATFGKLRWDLAIIDLSWWWVLCNQIPSWDYVKPSPSVSDRFKAQIPRMQQQLTNFLDVVSLHVSLLRSHVPFCITTCSCFGWEWVWCISIFSIVTDLGFSLDLGLNPLVDVPWDH